MAPADTSEPAMPAPAAIDQASLSPEDLARAVLDSGLRLRAASVRRLAEAVLAATARKKDKKEKSGKKSGGKKRKLAKIPGQKSV